MIFSQVLFIIYAMFLPVSFLLSMVPSFEGMSKRAITKLFNTILTRAGITLIITVAFSISTMLYNLSGEYPFFLTAFLQIVTFAGIYFKLGDSALKLVAVEYLNYMIEHPGVYEIIQWASWNGTEETAIIFNDYLSLLKTLICSCGFNPDKTTEILSMVTGMLHGYTTLQLRYAFSNPDKVRKELSEAIDTLLLGANQKYKD
jgi:hypothetical protein